MKNKKDIIYLIIAGVLFVGTLIFCLNVYFFDNKDNNELKVEEVSKTKDIEHVSYKDVVFYKNDGTEIKLSDYQNSPVVLLFVNKSSEDSIEELNRLEGMSERYADKINFFVINCAQDVDNEFQNNHSLEIYYDFYEEARRNYNVSEYPSIIYISEDNEVFNAKSGLTTTDALEANLDILSGNI